MQPHASKILRDLTNAIRLDEFFFRRKKNSIVLFYFSSYVQSYFNSAAVSSNSSTTSGPTNTTNSAISDKKCKLLFCFSKSNQRPAAQSRAIAHAYASSPGARVFHSHCLAVKY